MWSTKLLIVTEPMLSVEAEELWYNADHPHDLEITEELYILYPKTFTQLFCKHVELLMN